MPRLRHVNIAARLSRRPGVRVTAVMAVLAGTGLVLPGATSAAGQQVIQPKLEYACHGPAGWQPVSAQTTVTIPGTATAGQPIQPTGPRLTITFSQADRAKLGEPDTMSVFAELRTQATENGVSSADPWLLTAVSKAMPVHGAVMVGVPGTVQPVTEQAPGNLTFTASSLSLVLVPGTSTSVGGTSDVSTTPNSPGNVRLRCTLNPGQSPTLATVPVTAMVSHASALPARTMPATGSTTLWEVSPGGAFTGSAAPATFTDTTSGTVFTCTTSALAGTLKSGRELAGTGIGSLTSVTFSTCTAGGGRTFTVTTSATTASPWFLNVQSYDTTTFTTTASISGITASISGSGCSATVAGPTSTAPGTAEASEIYNIFFATTTLSINPTGGTLHLWKVSGCSGLFSSGDSITVAATYTTSPPEYVAPAYCPPFPIKTGFPFNKQFKLPPYPKNATVTKSPPLPPAQGCAYIKGFADAKKLNGAALVGPGFGNIQVSRRTIIINASKGNAGYFQSDSSGELYYKPCPGNAPQCAAVNGLPPATATFLSFGFMPTTATLQITQLGNLNVASVGTPSSLKYSEIQSQNVIRVYNVLVNGVPLNVGSDCSTAPFNLKLIGKPPYTLDSGGILSGTIDIPPFSGCGVGENLDSLFTATVSGPGNYVQLTQGSLCQEWPLPSQLPFCPPTIPQPIR